MKTYTIGEVISKFKKVEDKAYAYKGDIKGTLIFVDTDNENRLTSLTKDGLIFDFLPIVLNEDLTEEESRDWVFVTEMRSDPIGNQEMIKEYQLSLSNSVTNLYHQMTEEEKEQAQELIKLEENAEDLIKLEDKIRNKTL